MKAVSGALSLGVGGGGFAGASVLTVAFLGLPLVLGACTPPGWADPTEWFGGPAAPPERVAAAGAFEPGPYPLLGNVPDAAPRPSPQYQRDQRVQRLVAARAEARYTQRPTDLGPAAPPPRAKAAPTTPVPPGPAPAPPPRPAVQPVTARTAALPPAAPPASVARRKQEVPVRLDRPPEPDGWAGRGLLVGVIQFLGGSTSIDARDRSILNDIVLLQRQRGGLIRVVGHASGRVKSPDPAAHRLANLDLSLGRARNVALAMMELGVDPETLQVVAASASEPAYDESQPTGEAGNRRVEIFLEY